MFVTAARYLPVPPVNICLASPDADDEDESDDNAKMDPAAMQVRRKRRKP